MAGAPVRRRRNPPAESPVERRRSALRQRAVTVLEPAMMGDLPLGLDLLLRRAARHFGAKEVVSYSATGVRRRTYVELRSRVGRVGGMSELLGVGVGSRIASLCWSTVEHLELYFGVPCSGRVLHTVNPRFSPDQIVHALNEAGDEVVVAHGSLVHVIAPLLQSVPSVRHVVVVADGTAPHEAGGPSSVAFHDYEAVLGAAPERFVTMSDERSVAAICHTGGTTGLPKGVQYSHRSLVLHAMATMAAGGIGIHDGDVVLPIVPLFHANAVGFAHAAVGAGARLVLPGPDLSGPALAALLERESVTVTCGVPTIWASVLPHLPDGGLPNLRVAISGASAVPVPLSERFRLAAGVPLTQIWGMTETSPLATISARRSDLEHLDDAAKAELRSTVGLPVLGVELRVVDEHGNEVHDDRGRGELQVRGPWVASGYLGHRSPESFTDDGWLRTGDVACFDEFGNVRIVDRLKDLIKSGGEWISSIALEGQLLTHPDVAEVAVVAQVDDKWGERPRAFVVPVGDPPDPETLRSHLAERVPEWWIPDRFEFVAEIPRTSVGKYDKAALRRRPG